MEQYIKNIISGISNSYGSDFFGNIALELDKVIQADFTFISQLDHQAFESQTLALVKHGQLSDNFSYSLKDTPCADAAEDSLCCYPEQVCKAFPHDQLLIDMQIEAYIGTPLHNSRGQVMGQIGRASCRERVCMFV